MYEALMTVIMGSMKAFIIAVSTLVSLGCNKLTGFAQPSMILKGQQAFHESHATTQRL